MLRLLEKSPGSDSLWQVGYATRTCITYLPFMGGMFPNKGVCKIGRFWKGP
jgi:hypothetical protein